MTLHDQLEALFRDVFEDPSLALTDQMSAADVPEWDSLAHINIMTAIEATFNVRFSDQELQGFANIGELKRWLVAHVSEAPAGDRQV
jgi:acyl carrier protein